MQSRQVKAGQRTNNDSGQDVSCSFHASSKPSERKPVMWFSPPCFVYVLQKKYASKFQAIASNEFVMHLHQKIFDDIVTYVSGLARVFIKDEFWIYESLERESYCRYITISS